MMRIGIGIAAALAALWAGPALAGDAARDFKRLAPDDLYSAPTKWVGQPIELADVYVYWVGDDDVRLVVRNNLAVFASRVVPGFDATRLKSRCETVETAFTAKCKATVRFTYHWAGEDILSGYVRRIVLKSADAELTAKAAR